MRIRSILLAGWAVLVLAAGFSAETPRQESQEEKVSRPSRSSLIRMDLLKRNKQPLKPPLRNIFAPNRGGIQPARPGRPGGADQAEGEDPDEDAGSTPAEDVLPKGLARVNLRYIGYVRSAERTIAVIMFQGQPLAVHAGEMIEEGVTIVAITPEELVFQGADNVSRTVALEGEDR